ncbi:galactose-3-O-sulfotransferase 2-like [Mercenaria mercenaria]|uniref:galactose-3-O-sulfotransferase 2-like n=1 Tax=Mercenaria mercenaria TaxID=6596 RepID=UPI00234E5C11|nr:galactose-3-O-sulfotransferase 2-like [Mercenaria mercenaria]
MACIVFTSYKHSVVLVDKLPALQYRQRSTRNSTSHYTNVTTHVAFLKVHKAGSTTVQNLLFRFGMRHDLNILLPKSGNYLNRASQKMSLKAGQKSYDIFACHTIYQKQWFDSLLPTDSVYIGIVRDPVERMISSAYYYRDVFGVGYLKRVPRANFIHDLVNYPDKYDTAFFSHTRNSMGKDFGFRRGIEPTNKSKIRKYLDQLNSQFLLVLIMEKFDESLVMLKRLLNWSFGDIIYLKMNSHKHEHTVLNSTEIAKFRNTSFLDFEIYEYFSNVFETKLKQTEDEFYKEVEFFQTTLDKTSEFCSRKNKTEIVALSFGKSKWDEKFQVTQLDCEWMKTKELSFISKLRSTKHIQLA